MSESTAEKLQEAKEVLDRINVVGDLCMDAASKVLKADSEDSAKEALFEFAFFILAHDQDVPVHARLRDRDVDEVEEYGGNVAETKKMYDEVLSGDWKEVKDRVKAHLTYSDILACADKYGLDKDFKYKGVNIFLNKVGEVPSEVENAQQEYIKGKLDLVPNNTGPYTYPSIEELKRKIEISS